MSEQPLCLVCQEPVDREGKYTVVWDLPHIFFVHYECGETMIETEQAEEVDVSKDQISLKQIRRN